MALSRAFPAMVEVHSSRSAMVSLPHPPNAHSVMEQGSNVPVSCAGERDILPGGAPLESRTSSSREPTCSGVFANHYFS